MISRREFAVAAGGAFLSLALELEGRALGLQPASDGRLTSRPTPPARGAASGTSDLALGGSRDGVLQMPDGAAASPLPLLVLLHGAGGSGRGILRRLGGAAKDAGLVVLAPDARGSTWDAVGGRLGPDVAFLDAALAHVFGRVAIDPSRVSVGGFSDGATCALSLGLRNGDLFRRVVAWSPGFFVGGPVHGRPSFYIAHGTADSVLPIDRCSRRIVPALKARGLDVMYREFDGGHEIPPAIALAGLRWAARTE